MRIPARASTSVNIHNNIYNLCLPAPSTRNHISKSIPRILKHNIKPHSYQYTNTQNLMTGSNNSLYSKNPNIRDPLMTTQSSRRSPRSWINNPSRNSTKIREIRPTADSINPDTHKCFNNNPNYIYLIGWGSRNRPNMSSPARPKGLNCILLSSSHRITNSRINN